MDSKEKFSNKVEEYVKYRPSYPKEFIDYLRDSVGISKASIAADIGAGTGIFTRQLAEIVKTVYAVEPNLNMRKACEDYCKDLSNFVSVAASAEDTSLEIKSVDFITVAQAFHWFDEGKAKTEFQRILKPNGKVVLVWNCREPEDDLTKENEILFRRLCPDFKGFSGGADLSPEAYHKEFFKDHNCEYKVFSHVRFLTLEDFIGGSLSSSYAPLKQDANYNAFVEGLTELFGKYSKNGKILLIYNTHSYVGEI